jgi:hypothetical protein
LNYNLNLNSLILYNFKYSKFKKMSNKDDGADGAKKVDAYAYFLNK